VNSHRFLACLADDYARLRAVAETDLDAAVPSCPGWSVADLTRHVAEVYLHKSAIMRDGAEPEPWPPADCATAAPIPLLDRAYAQLVDEFAGRSPQDSALTWYAPDQSVGFWIRRMAQETVIHRIDAELGAGAPFAPVPDDLAIDGIDELLRIFVAYAVAEYADYFTEILAESPGRTYRLRADGAAWLVRTGPKLFTVDDAADEPVDGAPAAVDVTVSGPPAALLRWLWGRERDGDPSEVTVEGPPEAVVELRRCIVTATQ